MPRSDSVGPSWLPSRGVVVDHVEDDLDAGGVQRADHHLELVHGSGRRCATPRSGVRARSSERVVAPVVRQALLDQVPVVGVVVHRQQLDGGDAQLLEVLDRRFGRQPRVGAAQRSRRCPGGAS